MAKRKRASSGRRISEEALGTKHEGVDAVGAAQYGNENSKAELVQPDGGSRSPPPDDAPNSPIEFNHDSILRVRSASALSPSSSKDESEKSAKCLAISSNAGTEGAQQSSAPSKNLGSERREFAVLRSGEMFGTHYSLVRIELPGMQLSGAAWLSVLDGSVGVFGAILDPEDPPVLISAAPLSSLIQTLMPQGREKNVNIKYRREVATHPEALVHLEIRKAVFGSLRKLTGKRCTVLLTSVPTFTEDLTASDGQQNNSDVFHNTSVYPSLPGIPGVLPGTKLVPTASVPIGPTKFHVFREWQTLSSLTDDLEMSLRGENDQAAALRVLVCGAGGTGKSTLTRYLVNYLLLRHERVVLVDTDVGQPEMNPPGLVAAHVVSDFRLGAPTASTRNVPISARFLGETTPREEPNLYENLTKQVIEEAMAFAAAKKVAIVVNSDGWVNGIGAELLHHVAECCQPTHIVQLKNPDQSEKQSLTEVCARVDSDRSYIFESPGLSTNPSFTPSSHRDSQMASYFCKELMLGRVYQVPLDDVHISSSEEEGWDGPRANLVNGSVVALGEMSSGGGTCKEDCNIKGLGIVRGVNTEGRLLYLCSPIPSGELANCSWLIQSGGIQLPTGVVTSAGGLNKTSVRRPYLLSGGVLTGNVMRSRKTLNRR